MKLAFILLFFVTITSCSYFGLRSPSSTTKKHYIITMHGVRGNVESYGEFHQFVGETLAKVDPSYDYVLFNWTYPVGAAVNDEEKRINWEPHLIADKLNKDFFLGSNPKIPALGPDDKISIISYSMGGQMAMAWYYDTMFNFRFSTTVQKYSQADHTKLLRYLEKVDNMVGLGPVYWGSIDAELGWSILSNGDLTQLKKMIPKVKDFCESPDAKAITKDVGIVENVALGTWSKIASLWKDKPVATQREKNDKFLVNSLIATCDAIAALTKFDIINNFDRLSPQVLKNISAIMKSGGNINPNELNSMRLTSDIINEIRLGRIIHLTSDDYKQRFKAKWTSVVGVFPCLSKADEGLTCSSFKSENFKKMNDQLVTVFSGLNRRETDGPVFSPGAVADFIFYNEGKGLENQNIAFESFQNTYDLQKEINVPSKEIFVENMHATVAPALENLPTILGIATLKNFGIEMASSMKKFDKGLGVDVVIMNKECKVPETCEHPNFRHVVETLTGCENGVLSCDQKFVNRYFKVSEDSDRYNENTKLRNEMGSYSLVMNIRLPKDFKADLSSSDKILKYFSFQFTTQHYAGKGNPNFNEARLDYPNDVYANQIARSKEVMGSFATVREYKDSRVVRVFFMGRAWVKNLNRLDEAKAQLESGIPVRMAVAFPGVNRRVVVAKVKPTYTTYVDLYMK